MKKIILSLAILACSYAGFAQTHSDLSGNAPTATGEGYNYLFGGSAGNNCLAGGGVANFGGIFNQTWTINGTGDLVVTIPTMIVYGDERQVMQFYTGDCAATTIDLSTTANRKLEISLNSTIAGELVVVIFSGAQTNYDAAGVNVFTLVSGANTFSVTTLDLTGITNTGSISAIGFFARGPSFTPPPAGTLTVASVKIGDAVTTTSTNASIDNALLSVYPNPAKDVLNVDLSSLNTSDATVRVMNSTGMVVYEAKTSGTNEQINTAGFGKGMYMVQVSSANKISNKKVVIE